MHLDARLASVSIMNSALFGDRGRVGRAGDHQRDLAAAERRNIDGVEADADPGHHLHVPGGFEFGLAEAGAA